MEKQVSGVASVASAMGQLFSQAAEASNAARLQIAQSNTEAGLDQLKQEETVQRRTIARSLAEHSASVRASAAYRGGGGRSDEQAGYAATRQAADEAAVSAGNRAAKEVALIASNQVILEDPVLAGIRGASAGLDLGSSLAASLFGLTETQTNQSSRIIDAGHTSTVGPRGSVFENTIKTTAETPGLDLSKVFNIKNGNLSFNIKGLGF